MGSVSEKSTIPTASPADEHAGLRGMGRRRGDVGQMWRRKRIALSGGFTHDAEGRNVFDHFPVGENVQDDDRY
jgi:hypothetical protein